MLQRKSTLRGVRERFGMKPKDIIKNGKAILSCYEFNNNNDTLYNMRQIRDGNPFLCMYNGVYVRLHINNHLYMSDTNMERITSEEFIKKAKGRVLIAGLGIGLCIENLVDKLKMGEITELIIVEYYKDVIDLVSPFFKDVPNLKIVHANIFKYKINGNFDTIYFDIWKDINTDNLEEIKALHIKFKPFLNKGGWLGSWLTKYLLRKRKEDGDDINYYDLVEGIKIFNSKLK